MITFSNSKHMLKFFIHVDDHWTEGHIHQIVYAEAPIEGNNALMLVHVSYNIFGGYSHHLRAYEL